LKRRDAVVLAATVLVSSAVREARAGSVNLLTTVPTTVAVSSTVENPSILPAHLVDGKLDTAWNSLTGELEDAWFGVKIPDDAIVDTVKLTVGFTKVDKKWGDLFTMNPRISAVRITHDGALVTDANLDTNLRTLQEIKVGKLKGGTIVVQVLHFAAGTKKDWREINVSEFEVWGTPGPSTPAARAAVVPTVYVGSFAHSLLTKAQCLGIAPAPKGAKVVHVDSFDLTNDLAVCRVERADPEATDGETRGTTLVALAAVKRGARLALVAKLPDVKLERNAAKPEMGMAVKTATMSLDSYDLTTTEAALKVTVEANEIGAQYSSSSKTMTLYRIGAGSFKKVLEMGSSNSGSMNGGSSRSCTLNDVAPLTATIPAKLVEHCQIHHEGYPGSRDDKGDRTDPDWSKEPTSAFIWKNGAYEEQPGPDDNTDAPSP
jgi:hypothetical protein